jgi:hypothetical protein
MTNLQFGVMLIKSSGAQHDGVRVAHLAEMFRAECKRNNIWHPLNIPQNTLVHGNDLVVLTTQDEVRECHRAMSRKRNPKSLPELAQIFAQRAIAQGHFLQSVGRGFFKAPQAQDIFIDEA